MKVIVLSNRIHPSNIILDVLEIVYSAPSDIITPPPSPKSSPSAASFTANDRILTARRHGQLKYLMAEYSLLKKEGLMLHDHTYNLVFESYANLRRDGTPLAPMLKSKYPCVHHPFCILTFFFHSL